MLLCMEHLVDHFVICDLKNDRYEYYFLDQERKQPVTGKYSELIQQVSSQFQAMEKSVDLITCFSVKEIRANLQKESDIYKFEYCSIEEDILTGVIWAVMDITDEKKKEIQTTNEFLTHMSHNIRNPMNAIIELAAEIVGLSQVEVDCVRNGKEAVEKIEFSPEGWYNLAFMDIQMPIMIGYEAEFEHLVEASYVRESHDKEAYFRSLSERAKKIIYRDTRYNIDYLYTAYVLEDAKIMNTYAIWLYELMAGILKSRFSYRLYSRKRKIAK